MRALASGRAIRVGFHRVLESGLQHQYGSELGLEQTLAIGRVCLGSQILALGLARELRIRIDGVWLQALFVVLVGGRDEGRGRRWCCLLWGVGALVALVGVVDAGARGLRF